MTKIVKRYNLDDGSKAKIILEAHWQAFKGQEPYLSSNEYRLLINSKLDNSRIDEIKAQDSDIATLLDGHLFSIKYSLSNQVSNASYHLKQCREYVGGGYEVRQKVLPLRETLENSLNKVISGLGAKGRFYDPKYKNLGCGGDLGHRIKYGWHHTRKQVLNSLSTNKSKLIHNPTPYGIKDFYRVWLNNDIDSTLYIWQTDLLNLLGGKQVFNNLKAYQQANKEANEVNVVEVDKVASYTGLSPAVIVTLLTTTGYKEQLTKELKPLLDAKAINLDTIAKLYEIETKTK